MYCLNIHPPWRWRQQIRMKYLRRCHNPVNRCLLTHSMEQSPSWEATGFHLLKKFPSFYGTRKFITAFTNARHLSLTRASSIQSTLPNFTSWTSILILSSHLRLGLPSGLCPSGFPTSTLYTPLLSPIGATFSAHPFLHFITRTILSEEYTSLSYRLCSFLHPLVTSSLLGPNILLNTIFSNTLSLRSSLNVSDQVSHSYKTTGKIIVLYILVFTFLDSNLEDKRFCTEWQQAFPDFNQWTDATIFSFWCFADRAYQYNLSN